MKFSYIDIKSGNATCIFEIDKKKFEFYPSFHSDGLGDFVTYLASVHPLCKLSWKDGAFHKTIGGIHWDAGPFLLFWEFKRDFEDLTITITEKQNFKVEQTKIPHLPREIIKATCDFEEFVICVVRELDRIINLRGILGYRQEWQNHTFPLMPL
ncbi:hypothetical protein [Sutcliffiella rhizosphaerae]|uniref:Uncharacterized protein n=1 Tax=Sutcliffiella rhizosphaerae TaxID=2880967 RepID=A0ABM8YKN4_9BACI|nr:hypothetical protein [Sutcliffiella rhizosphaerae]CAG9620419.1 hypothetical protein BACCIP111883_01187 [Sutcliffiella rhizosphaerae]